MTTPSWSRRMGRSWGGSTTILTTRIALATPMAASEAPTPVMGLTTPIRGSAAPTAWMAFGTRSRPAGRSSSRRRNSVPTSVNRLSYDSMGSIIPARWTANSAPYLLRRLYLHDGRHDQHGRDPDGVRLPHQEKRQCLGQAC